jgi:hypothetical protein
MSLFVMEQLALVVLEVRHEVSLSHLDPFPGTILLSYQSLTITHDDCRDFTQVPRGRMDIATQTTP